MKSRYSVTALLIAFLALLSCHLGAVATAADVPAEPIATKGELVFSDEFARAELGDAWKVTTPTFAIADGVLKASQTKTEHSAVGRVKVGRKDLVIEFKFRLDGATSINAVCNDLDYKEGHAGHICRVSLSPKQILLADDKERLRHEIEEMRKDPKRKAEADKLVAGQSAKIDIKLEQRRWYALRIEIVNDEMRASLDDKPIGYLKSSGIAHPTKKEFYFSVSGKDALFDDLRIWSVDSQAFLGFPEDRAQKMEDLNPDIDSRLRGISRMTAVELAEYATYVQLKKEGRIVKEATRGGFVLFATEVSRHAPLSSAEGAAEGASIRVTNRYKARIPNK